MRRLLGAGVTVALGTDVSGGCGARAAVQHEQRRRRGAARIVRCGTRCDWRSSRRRACISATQARRLSRRWRVRRVRARARAADARRSYKEAFFLATLGGAKAVGLADEIGARSESVARRKSSWFQSFYRWQTTRQAQSASASSSTRSCSTRAPPAGRSTCLPTTRSRHGAAASVGGRRVTAARRRTFFQSSSFWWRRARALACAAVHA